MEEPRMDGADFDDSQFAENLKKQVNDNGSAGDKHSSSSDSDIDNYTKLHAAGCDNVSCTRQKPLHLLRGSGKYAEVVLWKNKRLTGGIFGVATLIWFLFECFGYHLLTFLCHSLMISLTALFVWSNITSFINLSPPELPKISMSADTLAAALVLLTKKLNAAFKIFHDMASGKDLKELSVAILVLWFISIIGRWFSFLTLSYLIFITLLTVPILYEKNEDMVDAYTQKAWEEVTKQYAVLDKKFLHKVPMLNSRKFHKQS